MTAESNIRELIWKYESLGGDMLHVRQANASLNSLLKELMELREHLNAVRQADKDWGSRADRARSESASIAARRAV